MDLGMDNWKVYATIAGITVGILIFLVLKLIRSLMSRRESDVNGVVVARSISHMSQTSLGYFANASQQIAMRRRTVTVFTVPQPASARTATNDGDPQQLDASDLPPDYDSALAARIFASSVHFSMEEDKNPPTYEVATTRKPPGGA